MANAVVLWVIDSFNFNNNLSIYIENNVGDKTPPCFTPLETEKYFEKQLFHDTRDCCLV